MRKILLFLVIAINFSVLPTHAADNKIVIDRLTQSEAEELDIKIPDEVPPGFHTVTIEVYDDKGTVSQKVIEFCKDNGGVVNWNNKCPDLNSDSGNNGKIEESQLVAPLNSQLKSYDPLNNPKSTNGIHIAAFAILAALTSIKRSERQNDEEEQESMQSITSGDLELFGSNPGKGDLSSIWNNKLTAKTDSTFISLAYSFNKFSPLLTRTVQDGNTIRAIFGSWASLLFPIGLLLGVFAAINTDAQALPPSWIVIGAIMSVAIFDAFAGLAAGLPFFLLILVSGNISSRSELLTTIAVAVLFFAPSLLASSFRPFRRVVISQDDLWERVTDYLLAILLTYWVVTKMITAMNGLSHLELPVSSFATELGIWAAALLLIRIVLEDITVVHFPLRLRTLHVEIKKGTKAQKAISLSLRISLFIIMAAPFVGYSLNLIIGTLLFALPQISSISLENRLPKRTLYLPKGVLKTVIMIFIMAVSSNLIENAFNSPADFIKWSFVLMAVPGFIFHYLEAFEDTSDDAWRMTKTGRKLYRIGGIIVFILMTLVVSGVDIASWIS